MGRYFYPDKRINIFLGPLGSGKTELAISTALVVAEKVPVALVDLDVINPYYRVRRVKAELIARGVNVVCPPDEMLQADVPALSPAVTAVLVRDDLRGVFDVGGDDIGTRVLGRFRPFLPARQHAVFFVVNTCRPQTATVTDVLRMVDRIEHAARVRIDYLVNNTNLGPETELATVIAGRRILDAVAKERGVPVAFTGMRPGIAEAMQALDPVTPVLPLKLFMRPPWE